MTTQLQLINIIIIIIIIIIITIESMKNTHKFSLKMHEIEGVQCKLNTSNKQILKNICKSFSNDLITIFNLLYLKEFHLKHIIFMNVNTNKYTVFLFVKIVFELNNYELRI